MEFGFKGYHPVTLFVFFISILVFGMFFRHPVSLAVCFFAALGYYIRLCGKRAVKLFFAALLPMLLFILVFNGITAHYGTTPLLTLPDGNSLTLEAVVYGFVLGVAAVTVMLWLFCYNEVVTTDKFLYVFGKLLPAAALVISMALRFLPMYRERLRQIAQAQRGIGQDPKSGSIFRRLRSGGNILSVLVSWSLENAVETSDSMRARGYGLKKRTAYSRIRWRRQDVVLIFVMLLLDALLLAGHLKQAVYCMYNPYIMIGPAADFGTTYRVEELNLILNPLSPLGAATLAAFALLSFLPLMIDGREDLRWRRLQSNI